MLLQQDRGNTTPSDDLRLAKEAAARSQESLKVMVGNTADNPVGMLILSI